MSQAMSLNLPILIFLAPLISAAVIGLLERSLGRRAYQIGTFAQFVGLAASLLTLYGVITKDPNASTTTMTLSLPLALPGLLQFGIDIDPLSRVMMALISAISLVITLFSVRYMQQDRGRARFHALLSLMTFTLLCMVASNNLLMLFFFWQLLSFMMYLLSHHYAHPDTVAGAARAYSLFRIGDVAFLVGIVIAYHLYGTLHFGPLFSKVAHSQTVFSLLPGGMWTVNAPTLITLLIFVGAMSKSVQFPMNLWLPGSLYAPTPVSALQHAGMINAGGFLLSRLAPLYAMSPTTLHIVFAVGLLTTLLGSSMMLTQNDIKKTLGHSTIGQMGYMMMECGLGAFGLAIFHLIAHGFFKATLFLNCGDVIHAARQEPKHPPESIKNVVKPAIKFSKFTWVAGFVMTLILPLVILMAAHGVLKIDLISLQGNTILLFFAWVTASQAILSLYRLQAVPSWKTVGMMLLTLIGVVFTYLFAAERFTHFLYPNPTHVAFFFQSAALPGVLFDLIVSATASLIIAGWVILYAKGNQQSFTTPEWIGRLQVRLYLLFINRLYLEALADNLGNGFRQMANRFSGGVVTQKIFNLIGFVVMPIVGLYLLSGMGRATIPMEIVQGVLRILALLCALYGSAMAITCVWTKRLRVSFGLAASSIFWWHLSYTGMVTRESLIYISAAGMILGGFFFVRKMLVARYGEDGFHKVGGLAREMPYFAFALSLLVMAGMGLPPFGFFSGLMGMLFHPMIRISWDVAIIALTWLFAAGIFMSLMQQIIFGKRSTGIVCKDLSGGEGMLLAGILLLLLVIGVFPPNFLPINGGG